MMKRWLIDTDVLIDHLRGVSAATHFLENKIHDSSVYLSAITVAELFAGVREGKEREFLEHFLSLFSITAMEQTIASQGGLFRRDYGRSHGVGLADAMIAATASYLEATLVTLNKKHYPMLHSVLVPYQKS